MRCNKHHLLYPAKEYRSGISKRCRELPCCIVEVDVAVHNLIHSLQEPPDKPSIQEMSSLLKRHQDERCGCYGGK